MPLETYIIKKAQDSGVDAIIMLYDTVNDYYNSPGWGKGVYYSPTGSL